MWRRKCDMISPHSTQAIFHCLPLWIQIYCSQGHIYLSDDLDLTCACDILHVSHITCYQKSFIASACELAAAC